jgi:iron(III) transport system substrate-binding protein
MPMTTLAPWKYGFNIVDDIEYYSIASQACTADLGAGKKMNHHHRVITRRSTLTGLGASIAAGLPHRAWAQAAGHVDKVIEQAATKEGKLVLLLLTTVTDETIGGMIRKFKSRYPFLNITYTIQSTPQTMNRFTAELSSRRAVTDWLMLPSNLTQTANYIARGAIAPYRISQDAAFPDDAKHGGMWYALSVERAVTVYRTGALSPEEVKLIRTYRGLGDPRFRGRLGINGVTNSVSVTTAYMLANAADKSLWRGLVANKPRVKTASPALLNGLLAGEYDISVFSSWGAASTPAQNSAPIEFGNTALTPTIYEPCGISALAPHPNSARLWQDWILSQEGQDEWVRSVGMASARSDAIQPWARRQHWFFDSPGTHKPLDWSDFSRNEAQVVARFKKDFQAG